MTLSLFTIIFSVFLTCWLAGYLSLHPWRTLPLMLVSFGLLAYAVGMGIEGYLAVADNTAQVPILGTAQMFAFVLSAAVWIVAFYLWTKSTPLATQPRRRLFSISLVCLGLEVVALFLPVLPFPRLWLYLALEFDIALLAILLVQWVAADAGESITYHAIRSFDGALLGAALFGSQVVLAATLSGGFSPTMYLLLLGVVVTATLVATFGTSLQNVLDALAFARFPALRTARADLRTAEDNLPRVAPTTTLAAMDDDEFVRHTRHALRSIGNLALLAANPLIDLHTITRTLQLSGQPLTPTVRAMALQNLLTDTITTLKPDNASFGASPSWRHYNALYYPYVVGLKPYSTKNTIEDIPPQHREAWRWFRDQVPERTLYHWQRAAVLVLATALKEQETA